jgi:2-polyprenyl-6-methoxyphenol hydroxylase-like FAD-dependent oxidoreductase
MEGNAGMPALRNVLVAGGGIGGLALGAALASRGIATDVVEAKPAHSALGVGIIQPGNALRAMRALGVLEECLAAGFPVWERRYHDTGGRLLVAAPALCMAGPDAPAYSALPRPALHRILSGAAQRAGVHLRMATTVSFLQQTLNTVEVSFSDGREAAYDLVVGADGIRSSLRRQLFGAGYEPRAAGYGCWRLTLPRPDDVDFSGIYQGGNGTKAGLMPLTRESMYLYLVTPEPGNPWMAVEALPELLRERLQGYGGLIGDIREGLDDGSDIVYAALEDVLLPAPWHRDRVLLIGDAAHASLPHMAQGAAMAVEDALVLAELATADMSMEERLATFMRRRYDRCQYVQQTSHAMADSELDYTPAKVREHQEFLRINFPQMWHRNELKLAEPI